MQCDSTRVCVCVCVVVIKAPHQNAAVIQILNCSAMNIKIARGEGFSPITLKNRMNSIMAEHACVKGFGGEVFLGCFGGGSRLKNSPAEFARDIK